ncbi:MAG: hypothetical protein K0U98_12900 [Deltaproteobacteria bacterium]|nr:hypothetical protein [Deltaproteobacteria bacterium]
MKKLETFLLGQHPYSRPMNNLQRGQLVTPFLARLLLFMSLSIGTSGFASEAPRIFSMGYEGSYFFSAEALEAIVEGRGEELSALGSFDHPKVHKAVRSMVDYRRALAEEGIRSSDECPGYGIRDHEEALTEFGEELDLETLVQRAPRAIVVKIIEVIPGAIGGRLKGSLVVGEVVGDLKVTQAGDSPVGRIVFWRSVYDFSILDVRVCAKRPGFVWAARGGHSLLLLPEALPEGDGQFIPFVEFPVEDGEAIPQPYPFVDSEAPNLHLDKVQP